MALLKQNETLSNGIVAPTVYYRIKKFHGEKTRIYFELIPYLSQESYANGIQSLGTGKIYNFEPSVSDGATNFIKQSYIYLKTLDEFKNSTDC
jgi:hypothetical protein